ncbi:hypothetical protein SAMN02910370_00700 [Lachnospiraceae bacterium XPB1003]|nr:hypothetical protein SAMN02910370_00700 [Lachnospiraceae bacterium XPB1003]
MARRYHEIKGLAEFTAKTIVSDERERKKFLHTAGHMYKYPFREQMLIYAQRPDATACASLELWNEKYRVRLCVFRADKAHYALSKSGEVPGLYFDN